MLSVRLETLIVWTEDNDVDLALSFQEADGCAALWYCHDYHYLPFSLVPG
jgi:hypothetical protein